MYMVMDGGIALHDLDMAKTWKNVTYGKNNAGSKTKLFAKMKADPNSYYHGRGDQQSEYGLTEKAVSSMMQHLGKYDPFQLKMTPDNTQIKSVGKGKEVIKTPIAVIFNKQIDVKILCKVPGAKIKYTTDGSEPTAKSPDYKGSIKLSKTTKLTVKAFKQGVGYSPTVTTSYVFK